MIPESDWMDEALCRGQWGLMFPEMSDEDAVAHCKGICAVCPVAEDCLDYALSTRQKFGIWGGTTEDERRSTLRSRQRALRREKVAEEHGVIRLFPGP